MEECELCGGTFNEQDLEFNKCVDCLEMDREIEYEENRPDDDEEWADED